MLPHIPLQSLAQLAPFCPHNNIHPHAVFQTDQCQQAALPAESSCQSAPLFFFPYRAPILPAYQPFVHTIVLKIISLSISYHILDRLSLDSQFNLNRKLTAHYYCSGRPMKNLYLTFVTNFIFSVLFLLSAQLRLPLILRLL